jgi:BirA family biotin operon repressor/biotin-[acetyl-CoA-carboxylase] ligase
VTGAPIDGLFGWRHLDLPAVGSTNAEALAIASEGDPGHLWVTAGEQLEGRGRRGRGWSSPSGNLYASVLLIDPAPAANLGSLPLVAAVAVREAIAACGLPEGSRLHIKWPNDILLNGAKCCGMLLESRTLDDGRMAVVAGCGINIASHPEPGLYPATALNREGIAATPATLFVNLARAMANALDTWDAGRGIGVIRRQWLENAQGVGQKITVNLANSQVEGLFEGIDAEGVLLLRTSQGTLLEISAGDLFFNN